MQRLIALIAVIVLAAALAGCEGSRAFSRGQELAEKGEWDLAIKEFEQAAQDDPKNIEYRSSLLRAQATASSAHYKKARTFLRDRKFDQAIVELQQALFLDPGNSQIQSALKSTLNMKQAEEHYRTALTFIDMDRLTDAVGELDKAVELDPENAKYHNFLEQIQKRKTEVVPETPLTLTSDKPITLHFKDTNIKDVFEFLSRMSGVNIIFDEDIQTKKITVFAKDVSFQMALDIVLSANKLYMKKLNSSTIVIIPKTKQKMEDYDDLAVRTFYLTTAKAKDIVNILRTMFDVRKIHVNDAVNSLSVRDTPEKIALVEKIIAANDLKEAEVILDVEILEILRSKTLRYGWNFSPSLTATAQIRSSSSTGLTLSELSNLTGDNILLTLPGIVVNLMKQDADAQTLANPQIRVLNNKQAKFHIGDRIPVQTSAIAATTANIVTTSFEYRDIGIKVLVEPTVHLNSTVSLRITLEVSTLGEPVEFGNGQVQYRFGNRSTDTSVNLRDGETVLIGGLIKDDERKSRIKIPLLGDVPVLGRLFSTSTDDTIKTDILMSIKPTIVQSVEIPDREVQHFWSGSEHVYDIKPRFLSTGAPVPPPPRASADKIDVLDSLALRKAPRAAAGAPQKPAAEAERPAAHLTTAAAADEEEADAEGAAETAAAAGAAAGTAGAAETAAAAGAAAGTAGAAETAAVAGAPGAPVTAAVETAPPAAEDKAGLKILPAAAQVQAGKEVRLTLAADAVRDLYGAVVTLVYDPKVMEFRTATEGELLKQDGKPLSFMYSDNLRTGTVDLYMTRVGPIGGVNGSGDLCTVLFQTRSAGSGEVRIKSVRMTNSSRKELTVEAAGAKVTVK